ncbi:hypothetical protein PENTCL1PPCAC_2691, partial [Pristionchus entomophagus]
FRMAEDLSAEQIAQLNALRALSTDPKQVERKTELGYLISRLPVSEQCIAKSDDAKQFGSTVVEGISSMIFVENATHDATLLAPQVVTRLRSESDQRYHRDQRDLPALEPIVARVAGSFQRKKSAERRRLAETTKRVEKLRGKYSQKYNSMFNTVGESGTQDEVIDEAITLDEAPGL